MAGYYEVIVRAHDHDLIPFVDGVAAGSGHRGIYAAQHAGLQMQPLRDRIKHRGEVQHVICADQALAALRDAIGNAPARYKFEVLEESKLREAEVRFAFKTPSRDVAKQIKAVLGKLPPGVTLLDYEPEEAEDPGARGAEVYSPAHDYMFRGGGVLQGDVGGVIDTRALLSEIEFVDCGEIELHR